MIVLLFETPHSILSAGDSDGRRIKFKLTSETTTSFVSHSWRTVRATRALPPLPPPPVSCRFTYSQPRDDRPDAKPRPFAGGGGELSRVGPADPAPPPPIGGGRLLRALGGAGERGGIRHRDDGGEQ
jgi:hypothetical protein